MPSPNPNTLAALDAYWASIQRAAPRAERNMDELQPSSTAAMSRLMQGLGPDDAEQARLAADRCVRLIRQEIVRLHAVYAQFNYAVSGEDTTGVARRETSEMWENRHAPPGCTSCGRPEILRYEPVDKNSANLCSWCMAFQAGKGFLPTPFLLQLHHEGKRMSVAVVERELRPLREAAKKLRTVKRASRKKGKAA